MAVLIKGYKLPFRCQECPFWKYEQPIWWRDEYIMWCSVTGEDLSKLDQMKRSDNCPMKEVKDEDSRPETE